MYGGQCLTQKSELLLDLLRIRGGRQIQVRIVVSFHVRLDHDGQSNTKMIKVVS